MLFFKKVISTFYFCLFFFMLNLYIVDAHNEISWRATDAVLFNFSQLYWTVIKLFKQNNPNSFFFIDHISRSSSAGWDWSLSDQVLLQDLGNWWIFFFFYINTDRFRLFLHEAALNKAVQQILHLPLNYTGSQTYYIIFCFENKINSTQGTL